jgi:multicomponent Na+:H+ antiporter subunit G
MTLAIEFASWVLILLGSFFTIVGALGIVRMPEIFTRMHAASVTDTLGIGFLILGMGLQAGFDLVTLKLVFLLALFFFTGPVVTHALAQACLHEGIKPLLAEDRRGMARQTNPDDGRKLYYPHQRSAVDLLAVVTIIIVRQQACSVS